MENLTSSLQVTAARTDLDELQQWLYEYLMYVQVGIVPTVELYPYVPHQPLLKAMRWRRVHLRLPDLALQQIPPRPLALLALRNYLENKARQHFIIRSVLWTVILLAVVASIFGVMNRVARREVVWVLKFLLLIPLDIIWSWRKRLPSLVDRETLEKARDGDRFIEAMEWALRFDIQANVPTSSLRELLSRVNILRAEWGYSELVITEEASLVPRDKQEEDDL